MFVLILQLNFLFVNLSIISYIFKIYFFVVFVKMYMYISLLKNIIKNAIIEV